MSVDNTKEYTCLSLCSGYGGLELGLKRACPNVRTVAYVEVEAFACANLVSKMEQGLLDAAPIWTDIKTFNAEPFRNRIHIITAGYPCQPFSVAGQRKGTDDPRHLWPHIERIIEAVRPVWFFGENVAGHLALGFPEVYRSLRNMGYTVEAGLFTAAECGASIAGERLFILAQTNGLWKLQPQRGKQNQWGRLNNSSKKTVAKAQSKGHATSQHSRDKTPRPRLANGCGYIRGVALQEEAQYDWEEPRTVAPTNNYRNRRNRTSAKQSCNEQENRISQQDSEHPNSKAKSRLGRAVDGTSCRVDRIRLLGNGVVPQQAEKAFRYLMNKANK